MSDSVYAKAIQRAAERAGGMDALAGKLNVSSTRLRLYADGLQPTPIALFLKVVDILLDYDVAHLGEGASDKVSGRRP